MSNTDAISLYYFLCSNVCCHLLEFINVWLSTSMLSSKLNFIFFLNLLVGNFCFNLSCQIYFSLAVGTKMVAPWSIAMFQQVFPHPCECKLLLKFRLDVVRDSTLCSTICVSKYVQLMLKWKSLTIEFNISGKISAQRFEISPQWFSERQPEKVICLTIGY